MITELITDKDNNQTLFFFFFGEGDNDQTSMRPVFFFIGKYKFSF